MLSNTVPLPSRERQIGVRCLICVFFPHPARGIKQMRVIVVFSVSVCTNRVRSHNCTFFNENPSQMMIFSCLNRNFKEFGQKYEIQAYFIKEF